MKIQYCSDLHLEFKENAAFIRENPIIPKAPILILAGDITMFKLLSQFNYFFDDLSEKFKQVYWIPGNHEYYDGNIETRTGSFCEKIKHNVFLVNNYITKIENVKLVLSTMWTYLPDQNHYDIASRLNDFHVIKNGSIKFSPLKYNSLYEQNINFIKEEVSNIGANEKLIVATHHVPTFFNYPRRYRGDILNVAFAVEHFDFIEKSKIDYWIYGHHHHNQKDFKIGNTILTSNQLGYATMKAERKGFDIGKIIDL